MTKTYIWERTFWRNAMERQSSAELNAILSHVSWYDVQNGFQTIPDVYVKGFEPIKMYFEVERGFWLAWHKNPLTWDQAQF